MHNEDNEEWFKDCFESKVGRFIIGGNLSKQEVVCMVMELVMEAGFPEEGPLGSVWKTLKEDEEDLIEFLDKHYPELK